MPYAAAATRQTGESLAGSVALVDNKPERAKLFMSSWSGKWKDLKEIGLPLWTSCGENINENGSTSKGCGVKLEGLKGVHQMARDVQEARNIDKEFDRKFLEAMKKEQPK